MPSTWWANRPSDSRMASLKAASSISDDGVAAAGVRDFFGFMGQGRAAGGVVLGSEWGMGWDIGGVRPNADVRIGGRIQVRTVGRKAAG